MKNKKLVIILCVMIFLALGLTIYTYINKKDMSYSKMSIEYTIKPENIKAKTIAVSIRLYKKEFNQEKLSLAKGLINVISPKCVDQSGNDIPFKDSEGIITIGPIPNNTEFVEYNYRTKLGEMSGNRVVGDLYEDLVVFSGENVLLLPFFENREDLYSINEYIDKITIQVDVDENWNAVMPYQNNVNKDKKVTINRPDWYVFYNLAKSCYAFGKFEPLTINTVDGSFNFLIDSSYKEKLTSENVKTIQNLYNYYTEKFGSGLRDYSIVLLRRNLTNDLLILGGVGGKSLGISFDIQSGDEWFTFSNTLYHAFFDSKIKAMNLHFPPNLWLYKGLASYYVDKSASQIPATVRSKYGIETNLNPESKYDIYLYFALKEPLLKVSPANEEYMLAAQSDFYYNYKVPFVIEAIENMAQKISGSSDNLLNVLMKYSNLDTINFAVIMTEILGEEEAKIRAYLSGEDIVPFLWDKIKEPKIEETILNLDMYERYLTLLFQTELGEFPYDPVILLEPKSLLEEIKNSKISFATQEIQEMVRNYSETIYLLLMQNALRAKICGQKDLSNAEIRYVLNNSENIEKWTDYVSKVGLYGSSEGSN